ncbi:MAG: GDSL-type esterase/lipase family protein [Acidobacteriota bacterium]
MRRFISLLIISGVLAFAPMWCEAQSAPLPSTEPRTNPGTGIQILPQVPADQAQPRVDQNSQLAHLQLLEKKTQGRIDIYFEGDSIVRRWGATDYPLFLANWTQNFWGWNAADFGWGADRTQNILWRLQHGELDGVHPKIIVFLGGTNNVGTQPGSDAKVADITRGLRAIVDLMREKAPAVTIVLTAIFPRNDNIAVMPTINAINRNLASMADGKTIRFVDVNAQLADADGRVFEGVLNPDRLHPSLKGYQIWADALKPIFTEILGPPAATDTAPPPTGDPSAAARGAAAPPPAARQQ